ncbi:SAM-dependent DNA methyltransferase [Megamonas funiformis]|uniref:class I SAM-dependent DNA methyltransferase n=1 Tax=Megamonas funiformis TaxID=437897 RepID=UPI00142F5CA1|nr:class I SAM-dependent DNA methyltransferase [Megamonas funiformis]NJE27530.1 SAM-dependent DNA methyltransferase [Megamonas funiformis]
MSLGAFVKNIQNIMRGDSGVNGDAQRIEQLTWLLFLKIYAKKEEDWELFDENYKSILPEECKWENWAVDDADGKSLTGDKLLEFVNEKLFKQLKEINLPADAPMKHKILRDVFVSTNQYMKDGVLLRQLINEINKIDFDNIKELHAFGEIYETILKSLQSAGNAGEFYTPRAVTDFIVEMVNPKLGETVADFACGTGGFLTSTLNHLEKNMKNTEDRTQYNNAIYGIEKKPLPHLLCVTNMLVHDIDNPAIYNANSLERNVREYKDNEKFEVILMNPPYGGAEGEQIKNKFPADLRSSETADLFISLIMYRLKENGRAAVIIPDGFLFGLDNAKVAIKKKLFSEFNVHTIIRLPASVFAPYTSITTNIIFFDNTGTTKETYFYRLDMPEEYKHFSKTKPMKLEHFADCIKWWNDRYDIQDEDTDTYKAKVYTLEEIVNRNYDIDLCGYPTVEEEVLSPEETILEYKEKRATLNTKIDKKLQEIENILGVKLC